MAQVGTSALRSILQRVGAPVTAENLRFLEAWQQAEGGGASFNPFNTTQPASGASSYNSVGVRNYGSLDQGIGATVQTLENGHYGNIVGDLRSGHASAMKLAQDVAASPWGTGAGVERVLGGKVNVPAAGALPSGGMPSLSSGGGLRLTPSPADQTKSMLASWLLSQATSGNQNGGPDFGALLQLAQSRQGLMAAHSAYGPTPSPTAQLQVPTAPTVQLGHGHGYVLPVNGKVMRLDQGVDVQGQPGAPVRALGSARVDAVKSDPNGFGQAVYYTVLNGPLKGRQVYVGHAAPNVKPGMVIRPGTPVATLLQSPLGNATQPGWTEIGFAQNGAPQPGSAGQFHSVLTSLGI